MLGVSAQMCAMRVLSRVDPVADREDAFVGDDWDTGPRRDVRHRRREPRRYRLLDKRDAQRFKRFKHSKSSHVRPASVRVDTDTHLVASFIAHRANAP